MLGLIRAFAHDRRGATAVEYGLILSLVVLAMLAALTEFASVSVGMWSNVSTAVQNAK